MISFRKRAYSSSDFTAHDTDVFWVTGNKRSQTGEIRVDIDGDSLARIYILVVANEELDPNEPLIVSDSGSDDVIGVSAISSTGGSCNGVSASDETVASGEYFWMQIYGQANAKSILINRGERCRTASGFVLGESGGTSGQVILGHALSDGDTPSSNRAYIFVHPGMGVRV